MITSTSCASCQGLDTCWRTTSAPPHLHRPTRHRCDGDVERNLARWRGFGGIRCDEDMSMREKPWTPDYEYEVTQDGRVYSLSSDWRGYGKRELKQQDNSHGYPSVRIVVNGRRKRVTVHRLVAQRFLPPRPSPKHQIRHVNGNRQDNRASNLKWGTAADNAKDRELHGNTARGSRINTSRLTENDVLRIRRNAMTVTQVMKAFDVSQHAAYEVVNGLSWRHINV